MFITVSASGVTRSQPGVSFGYHKTGDNFTAYPIRYYARKRNSIGGHGDAVRLDGYGRTFVSRDAMERWALSRGYTQLYFASADLRAARKERAALKSRRFTR